MDSASSNFRAERAILASRRDEGHQWQSLFFACEVHKVSIVHRRTFSICDDDISGQVHLSLAVNLGTGMLMFGRLLRAFVRERLVVMRGRPPRAAQEYRQHLLRLCMARGSRLLAKRLYLSRLPNGDWRKREVVEVYVPEHVSVDRSRIAEVVGDALQQCVAGAHLTTYPRHRWTKADRALDDCIMLDAIHGLLSAVFPLWCRECGAIGASSGISEIAQQAGGVALVNPRFPALQDMPEAPAEPLAQAKDAPTAEHSSPQTADAAREDNETHRRVALSWLRSEPLTRIIIIRQAMEPLRQLMAAHLVLGSLGWEEQQDEAAASAATSSSAAAEGRSYAVVEAASGRLERQCREQVGMLLNEPRLWEHLIPAKDMTLEVRHFCFRLLSGAEALVQEYLALTHAAFPMRMFSLLAGARLADILSLPPCCMDEWSADFASRHRLWEEEQVSPEAMAELRLVAILAKVDVSGVEATHASIRRRLFGKGVQTRPLAVAELSAEFALDRARRRGEPWAPPLATADPAQAGDGGQRGTVRKGGPWRAFVREQSFGRKGLQDNTTLSARYHDLSGAEKERLVKIGAAATKNRSSSQTSSSFGLRAREVERAQVKRLKAAASAGEAVVTSGSSRDVGTSCDNALRAAAALCSDEGVGDNLPRVLTVARAILQGESRLHNAARQRGRDALVAWRNSTGEESKRTVLQSMVGEGMPLAKALEPRPCCGASLFNMKHPVPATAALFQSLNQAAQQTNLGAALEAQWSSLHQPILQKESKQINEQKQSRPRCAALGCCVCSKAGKAAERARAGLYSKAKVLLKPDAASRSDMLGRMVIALLTPVAKAVVEASPWASALAGMMGEGVGGEAQPTFWHVCSVSLRPFALSFRPMTLLRVDESGADSNVKNYHLQAGCVSHIHIQKKSPRMH